MSKFCESTYEEAFIDLLEQNGWEYKKAADVAYREDGDIGVVDLPPASAVWLRTK